MRFTASGQTARFVSSSLYANRLLLCFCLKLSASGSASHAHVRAGDWVCSNPPPAKPPVFAWRVPVRFHLLLPSCSTRPALLQPFAVPCDCLNAVGVCVFAQLTFHTEKQSGAQMWLGTAPNLCLPSIDRVLAHSSRILYFLNESCRAERQARNGCDSQCGQVAQDQQQQHLVHSRCEIMRSSVNSTL